MFKMNGYKPGLPRTRQLDMVQRYAEGGLVRAPQRPADRRPPTSTPGGADMVDYHMRRIEGYTQAINNLRSQGREVPEDYYRMVRESQEALSPPPLAPQMPPPAPPMPGPDPQVDPNPRFSGRDTPPSAPPISQGANAGLAGFLQQNATRRAGQNMATTPPLAPGVPQEANARASGGMLQRGTRADLARMYDKYPVAPTPGMPAPATSGMPPQTAQVGMPQMGNATNMPVEVAQPREVSSEPIRPRRENPAKGSGFWDKSSARINEYFKAQELDPVTGINTLLPDDPDLPTAGDRMAQDYGVPSGEGEFGSGQSRNRGFGPPSPDMEGQRVPQGISGVTNPAPRSAGAPATGAAPSTGANASPSRGASAPAGTPPGPTMRPPMQQPGAPAQGGSGGTGSPGVRGIGSLGAEDTPSAPVVQTDPGAKPAQSESSPEDYKQKDFYDFLLNAGLNILASDSPYFGQAIGEGGVAGLKSVKDAQNQRYDRARQEMMDQLYTEKTRSDMSQGKRRLDLSETQIKQQNALGWGRIASDEALTKYTTNTRAAMDLIGMENARQIARIGANATESAARARYGAEALADRKVSPEDVTQGVYNALGISVDKNGIPIQGAQDVPPYMLGKLKEYTASYILQGVLDPTAAASAALLELDAYMTNNPPTPGFLGLGGSDGGLRMRPGVEAIPSPYNRPAGGGGGGGQPDGRYVPGQGLVRPGAQ
jgi:hypothetical protein